MARVIASLLLTALIFVGQRAEAAPLEIVADLSSHRVSITTGFTGTDLLLFGALDGRAKQNGDVVVVITGPPKNAIVRLKERVAGIWVNTQSIEFKNAPSFYWLSSSRPLPEIASPEVLARLQFGVDNLDIRPTAEYRATSAEEQKAFREGLVRMRVKDGHYRDKTDGLSIVSRSLFRTRVMFPANVPTGVYNASVYLIRDGQAVHAQTTPLVVSKAGVGAEVYLFAHRQSAIYGIISIFIAVFAGWLAAAVFRKV